MLTKKSNTGGGGEREREGGGGDRGERKWVIFGDIWTF